MVPMAVTCSTTLLQLVMLFYQDWKPMVKYLCGLTIRAGQQSSQLGRPRPHLSCCRPYHSCAGECMVHILVSFSLQTLPSCVCILYCILHTVDLHRKAPVEDTWSVSGPLADLCYYIVLSSMTDLCNKAENTHRPGHTQ